MRPGLARLAANPAELRRTAAPTLARQVQYLPVGPPRYRLSLRLEREKQKRRVRNESRVLEGSSRPRQQVKARVAPHCKQLSIG